MGCGGGFIYQKDYVKSARTDLIDMPSLVDPVPEGGTYGRLGVTVENSSKGPIQTTTPQAAMPSLPLQTTI